VTTPRRQTSAPLDAVDHEPAGPPSLGLLVGGIPAVLIAAFIVKSLPLSVIGPLVVVVVVYAAVGLVRAAQREKAEGLVTATAGAAVP